MNIRQTDLSRFESSHYYKSFFFNSISNNSSSLIVTAEGENIKDGAKTSLDNFLTELAQLIKAGLIQNKNLAETLKDADKSLSDLMESVIGRDNFRIIIMAFVDGSFFISKYGPLYACIFSGGKLKNIDDKSFTSKKINSVILKTIITGSFSANDKFILLNKESANLCDLELLEKSLGGQSLKQSEMIKTMLFKNQPAKAKAINFSVIDFIQPLTDNSNNSQQKPSSQINDSFSKNIIKTAGNLSPDISLLKNIPDKALQFVKKSGLTEKLKRHKKNRFVIFIIVAIIALTIIYAYRNISDKKQFNKILETIENNYTEATILLSNKNASLAVEKLIESRDLTARALSQFPELEAETKKAYEPISLFLNNTAKIIEITSPEKISELNNFGIKFSPRRIIVSGNNILTFGTEFGLVYKISLENGKKGFNFFTTQEDSADLFAKSSNSMAFLSDKGKLYIYQPIGDSALSFSSNIINKQFSISEKNISFYDAGSKQIQKYSRSNMQIIENIKVQKEIIDFAEDNKSIFAISKENEILEIAGGTQKIIANAKELPIIKLPNMIFTNSSLKNLYVTSADGNVVVFQKSGDFIKQYDVNIPENIIDLEIINDSEAFILTENSIYKISLN